MGAGTRVGTWMVTAAAFGATEGPGPVMRERRIIATAVEWNGAHARERVYYSTYARDLPDPAFRFSINVVEHTYSLNMHGHEYAELIIVLGGRALHLTEFENHQVNGGDVVVINPKVRHGFMD